MLRSKDEVMDAILDAVDEAGTIALQDLYAEVAERLSLNEAELTDRTSNGMPAY